MSDADWLDADQVAKRYKRAADYEEQDTASLRREVAYLVVNAIADLDSPNCYVCGRTALDSQMALLHDPNSEKFDHLYTEALSMQRVWTACRAAIGAD